MTRTPGVLLAALAALAVPLAAAAQSPDAAGVPVADDKMAAGTLSIRLVRGKIDDPIIGIAVTLAEEGKADSSRSARTTAEGRAEFKDLPAGSKWVATATVDEAELTSRTITIPGKGGVRVVLSPVPLQMPSASAGGAGNPPMSPLQMRSRPRGERTLPPGTLQLRVVRGDWQKPAVGQPIHLVGLAGTGEVLHEVSPTGPDGRVSFTNLRPDVAWYPMTVLPRGDVDDRLVGLPVTMPPRVGIAMAMSGLAPESTEPASDDLGEFYTDQGVPAGEVQVRVGGRRADLAEIEEVELIDATTGTVLGKARTAPAERIVQGQFVPPRPDEDSPDGRVIIGVVRGTPDRPFPVDGVDVELVPAAGGDPVVQPSKRGTALFDGLKPGDSYTPAVTIHGVRIQGDAFKVPDKKGLVIASFVDWEDTAAEVGEFHALIGGNDHVYVVRATAGGRAHLSPPFQLTRTLGAFVRLEITPPPQFQFHTSGTIDDERMFFQMQVSMSSSPFAPYTPPGGNLRIPLPRGFGNASVEEQWSDRVKIDGQGLVWKGAVPPGGFQFNAAFSLPIDDGELTFDMDLPGGAVDSSLVFDHRAGMKVETAGRAQGGIRSLQGRRFYVINGINIGDGQAMVMRVSGLPQPPGWRTWVRNGAGVVVLLILLAGLAAVFVRRPAATADPAVAERERLLDQLVDLEKRFRDGGITEPKYRKQRGRLTQRLEGLYGGTTSKAEDAGSEE